MGPLPKKRYAKARQGLRRAHLGIPAQVLMECPQCHSQKRPHTVCPTCGTYDGREVVEIKVRTKKEKKSE
jgi:large subunit ribosomal protein L32